MAEQDDDGGADPTALPGGRTMRILAYILSVLVSTVLSIGGALLVAIQLRGGPDGLVVAAGTGVALIVYGPLLLGSWNTFWDRRSSPDAGRYLRRVGVVVLAVDLAAVGLLVVATVVAGGPVWVPVLVALVTALLLVVARPLGDRLRRAERPLASPYRWQPVEPGLIRRKLVIVSVVFAGMVVLASAWVVVEAVSGRERGHDLATTGLLGAAMTFMVPAFVMVVLVVPLQRRLRDAAGRDLARLRQFNKVVLRGKALDLSAADQRAAARYASTVPTVLGLQIGYLALLYAGIACNELSLTLDGMTRLGIVYLGVLVVGAAVAIPAAVGRMRRARAYAVTHADLLDDHGGDDGVAAANVVSVAPPQPHPGV
ncbi:hypothetical protein [Curtobacterium sp. MCBD17_019]|uniref:hypothetical protein n=1 Tax=Curtobacterium sp. MCBD17_019 TaxID=2175669 RepID=UPI000DA9A102|nr:hypothetical protein [Curtobacterium sp. MCBD17_019]PZE76543.1 hypothetical protein DEI82_05090 [Curtobacterium sp. MCBD17_019]